MSDKILSNSTILVTILTAILYLSGFSFNLGYINEFGATAEIFEVSFHNAILLGFVAITGIFEKFGWHLFIILVAVIMLRILLSHFGKNSTGHTKENDNSSEDLNEIIIPERDGKSYSLMKKSIIFFDKIIDRLSYFMLLIVVIVSITAIIVSLSNDVGTESAIELKDNFRKYLNDDLHNDIRIVEFLWNGNITKGVVVSHSNNYILIYTENFDSVIFNNSSFDHLEFLDS